MPSVGRDSLPLAEVPRAPRENNALEELLKCPFVWDVRVPGLQRARSGCRGRVPEANQGGCPRPRGRSGLGRALRPPDSQVVSTGHRRQRRRIGAEEPGWVRRSQAQMESLAPVSRHF